MRDDLATFFRPFVILIFVAVPVLALALPGDWTTRRIWAAAAMYLIGFAILGAAYLFLRSPMGSVPGDTSQWLHHWEAQAWRRYARQHDRRGAGASSHAGTAERAPRPAPQGLSGRARRAEHNQVLAGARWLPTRRT